MKFKARKIRWVEPEGKKEEKEEEDKGSWWQFWK